ncbi:39S ribosomal protein L22, mitochondrial [Collariella sp. IMI 366227]|nr:39S ribosomal protein L22, mitochondrial [Collariella sp. IMI 366227]
MSLSVPSRRLLRGANQWFWNRKKDKQPESSLKEQLQGSKDTREKIVKSLSSRIEGPAIFEDETRAAVDETNATIAAGPAAGPTMSSGASLVREHMARAVDPDPRSRVRWERKMVMRQVQRGTNPYSREPRAAVIARTERQLTSKSPWLATSTKKLVKLAHQIQGKSVADALTQMRFSKKKMAKEVKYQLEIARDLAVAERGMGMGAVAKKEAAAAEATAEGAEAETTAAANNDVIKIQDKDGKWVKIADPTRMYIAEAWVNRGPWREKYPDYRARGRTYIKQRPTTSISIVLKEEKTRIREHEERKAKKLRQGPWIHLPDRPVTAQRQYYSW